MKISAYSLLNTYNIMSNKSLPFKQNPISGINLPSAISSVSKTHPVPLPSPVFSHEPLRGYPGERIIG